MKLCKLLMFMKYCEVIYISKINLDDTELDQSYGKL